MSTMKALKDHPTVPLAAFFAKSMYIFGPKTVAHETVHMMFNERTPLIDLLFDHQHCALHRV